VQSNDVATTTKHAVLRMDHTLIANVSFVSTSREHQPCAKQRCSRNNQTRCASNGPHPYSKCIICISKPQETPTLCKAMM
jgi:hypothetical protein